MGEYAKRHIDGVEVKIGTCECMYYLRYDRRKHVDYDFGSYSWLWRIPTPDEDQIKDGEYEFGGLLYDGKYIPYRLGLIYDIPEDIVSEIVKYKGNMQLHDDRCGLLVNMPCYHGLKLPENTADMNFHWNGKSECIYLSFLKNDEKELKIGTACKLCRSQLIWSFTEIAPLMNSLWMKMRLLRQCTEYWYEHNEQPCTYEVIDKTADFKPMGIYNLTGEKDAWQIEVDDQIVETGTWETCRNRFIALLGDRESVHDAIYRNHSRYYDEIAEMKHRYLGKIYKNVEAC